MTPKKIKNHLAPRSRRLKGAWARRHRFESRLHHVLAAQVWVFCVCVYSEAVSFYEKNLIQSRYSINDKY